LSDTNEMPGNDMTGGEALARMIQAYGGGPMFGMGGFQLLPFYDAARRLGLDHHLINDERAGVFAADAYAKVSGRVGLVDATLGPGATNLVTGLVEALNAGTPMVALVGDAHRDHAWKNMTQESRQAEILRPACKEFLRVESAARIPELMRRAFTVATTGRPGPVVVDVPEDVCHATYGYAEGSFAADPAYQAAPALRCRPDMMAIERAARAVSEARRPMVLAGGGVHLSGAADTLAAFAHALNVPVAHTMTGKGAVACTDPLSAGLFGRYDRIANTLIAEADLLLVVGCKLGEIATKRYTVPPPGKRIVHVDIVAEEIGRTAQPEMALWGDARETLRELHLALADEAPAIQARQAGYAADIAGQMAAWRAATRERYESDEVPVSMGRLMGELNRLLPADGILVADGGFAAHWGGLLFDTRRPGRGFVAVEAADRIRAESNGALDIQLFPNNQLGADTDVLSQLRSGAVEFFTLSGLILATLVPTASINGIGFAFNDYDAVWRAMDGELGALVRTEIARGSQILAMERIWDNGFRHMTTSTKPIVTPADLEGFKMRVPVSPLWTSMFKAFGSSPISVNAAEMYSALQTRIADGQENPLANIWNTKIYEVQKYAALTGHMWDGYWPLANRRAWMALPADLRAIAAKHLNDGALLQRADLAALNTSLRTDLEGKGMVFNEVDKAAFRDKLTRAGFYKEWREKYGEANWTVLARASGQLS